MCPERRHRSDPRCPPADVSTGGTCVRVLPPGSPDTIEVPSRQTHGPCEPEFPVELPVHCFMYPPTSPSAETSLSIILLSILPSIRPPNPVASCRLAFPPWSTSTNAWPRRALATPPTCSRSPVSPVPRPGPARGGPELTDGPSSQPKAPASSRRSTSSSPP